MASKHKKKINLLPVDNTMLFGLVLALASVVVLAIATGSTNLVNRASLSAGAYSPQNSAEKNSCQIAYTDCLAEAAK